MLFRAYLFLVFFLALLSGSAEAAPIFGAIAAIGSAISSFVGASVIGGIIVKTVLSLGMSLVQQAIARKKAKKNQQRVGVVLDTQTGDDQPMSVSVGSRATAGRRKYWGTWGSANGTPNAYFTDVIEIGSLPSYAGPLGITSLWCNEEKCGVLWDQPHPDGLGYPVLEFRDSKGRDNLWVRYLDGTQTVADPWLRATFGAHADRPFLASMIGRGCQVLIVTARYSDKFNGAPAMLVEPHPYRFYDLRKDSTNGGSGTHRWNDPSTWEPTLNPIVMIYNIARGIYYGGEWVYGGQNVGGHRLPAASWIAAANECDRVINGNPQFRAGTEIFFDQEPLEIIEDLRLACNARFAEVGGALKVLVGLPGAAVFNFTDEMVIVSSDQELDPFPSLSDTHNTIAATYPEPEERWAMKDAPEYIAADHVTADGRSLRNALAFEAVPFSAQVQHLQKTMEEDGRRFIVHELTMPPSARLLEPLDCVAWSSLHNNYSSKLFLIIRITRLRGSFQRVLLKEVDPDDYDPPAVILPPSTGWIGPIVAPPQPMTGWAVEPATVKDAGGVDRRPAIRVSCAADLDDVKNVWVQARVKATGTIVFDSDSTAYADPFAWLLSGAWCLPATEYEVRGKYVPYTNRETTWSAWLSVTTPNVLIASGDILDNSITAAKIANAAVTADKIMDDAVSSLKLAAGAVTSSKLAVAAVTAAAIAIGAVVSDKLADAAVTATKLADAAVTATKFASGIKPVEVLSALPSTGNAEGRQVYLTTDGKLYRYHSGAWTASVEAADIAGTITSTQIADNSISTPKLMAGAITTAKLAAGAVTANELAANAVVAGKIAAGAVSADQIAAGAITAAKIAAGAISADKLAVGRGANWIENSDLYAGLTTWAVRYSNALSAFQLSLRTDSYAASGAAIQIRHIQAVAGEVYDLWPMDLGASTGKGYAVEPGNRYEFSIYGYGLRADRQLYIGWQDAAGNLTYASSASIAPENGNPQSLLSNYTRSTLFATAPAGTVKAYPFVRHRGTSQGTTDSYVWFRNAYFGEAGPNQTDPSPWSPSGTTLVDAGQIVTGAVIADKIATNAVTASKINAGAVTATAIAAGAVTTDKLSAGSVTASKVAADAIGANHIAANSITAKQLVLTDFENLVPNGYFNDGTVAAWGSSSGSGGFYIISSIVQTGAYSAILQKHSAALGESISVSMLPEYDIAVTAGEILYGETSVMTNGLATSAGAYYRVNFYDGAKSFLSYQDIMSNAPIPTSWTKYSRKFTVPAGARYARIQLYNHSTQATTANLIFDRLILRRAKAAELIVDGGIIADHLAANSVTAEKISVSNLAAISATLGTVNISSATIGTLQVGRSNIISGAVSRVDYAAPTGAANILTSNTAVTGLTSSHGTGTQAVIVHSSFNIYGTNDGSGSISVIVSIWDDYNNTYTAAIPLTFKSETQFAHEFNYTPPAGRSATQFRFDVRVISGTNVVANNRTIRIMTLYR